MMDHTGTLSHRQTDFQFVTWFPLRLVLLRATRAPYYLQAMDTLFLMWSVTGIGRLYI